MSEILLSISIPTFNRSEHLRSLLTTIHSSLSGREIGKNIEVVVSDNCSLDNTPQVIEEISSLKKSYKFTSSRNSKNIGGDKNRMKVLLDSSGEFAWLLGDDDEIFDDSIGYLYELLKSDIKTGFAFINYYLGKEGEKTAITSSDDCEITTDLVSFTVI